MEGLTVKPADIDVDRDAVRMGDLVDALRRELSALEALLPAAMDAQWTKAPIARPREDSSERSKNRRIDPTSDIVLDPDRLRLRNQVAHCALVLTGGVVALRRVHEDVGRALEPWQGEGYDA